MKTMSNGDLEKITCPNCGEEGDFVVQEKINTALDPEAKAKILSGEFFRFKCTKCGNEIDIGYNCIYHQMEDHFMIMLVISDDLIDDAVKALDNYSNVELVDGVTLLDPDYALRIVKSQIELQEKVYIFDQGLDDRVIELMKIITTYNAMADDPDLKIVEFRLGVIDGYPEYFEAKREDGRRGRFPFNQNLYDKIKVDMIDPNDYGRRLYFVNREWAYKQLSAKVSNK